MAGLGRDDRLDVVAGEELEVVDGVDVRRVGHRDDQRRAGAVDRDDLVLLGDLLRDELEDRPGRSRTPSRLIAGTPYCLREEVGELRLLDRSDLDQRGADAGAVLLLLLLRFAQLLERDQVLADEQFTEATGTCVRSTLLKLAWDGHRLLRRATRAGRSAVEASDLRASEK